MKKIIFITLAVFSLQAQPQNIANEDPRYKYAFRDLTPEFGIAITQDVKEAIERREFGHNKQIVQKVLANQISSLIDGSGIVSDADMLAIQTANEIIVSELNENEKTSLHLNTLRLANYNLAPTRDTETQREIRNSALRIADLYLRYLQ